MSHDIKRLTTFTPGLLTRHPNRYARRLLALGDGREEGEGEGECSVVLEWFRSAPGGSLAPIPGLCAHTVRYRPTIDDVGACIAVRASLLTPISLASRSSSLQQEPEQGQEGQQEQQEPPFAAFAEVGPFALAEPTAARLRSCLAAQKALTFRGLRELGHAGPHVYDLVVGPAGVELRSRSLVKAALPPRAPPPPASKQEPLKEREPWSSSLSDDDEDEDNNSSSSSTSSSMEDKEAEAEADGGGGELVGRGPYSRETLVALHPLDPTALLVQLPLFLLSSPLTSPADEHSEQRQMEQEQEQEQDEPGLLVQRALQVGSSEERDVLALLWRAWRREALQQCSGEGDEPIHDAVLLAGQLKEQSGQGHPAVVRVPSEGDGEQEEGPQGTRLLSSSSSSSSSEEDGGGDETEHGVTIRRMQQELADAREQLAALELERQQGQGLRRASSSSNATGGGLGGFLMMRRASREGQGGEEKEKDREETIRVLRREVEALQGRVAELEGLLQSASEEAVRFTIGRDEGSVRINGHRLIACFLSSLCTNKQINQAEARDHLAEATARANSLAEETEHLQVQEEALGLQRASNEQALALARGEMESLRAEARELRAERDRDRAYLVGEVRDHAVRLEEAEAGLIAREGELAEARKEMAWVRACPILQSLSFTCLLLS